MAFTPRSRVKKNFYKILGVPASSTLVDIKSAFRKLAKEHHPDRCSTYTGKVLATRKMTVINEAYAVLSNPEKRTAYDQMLASSQSPVTSSPSRSSPHSGASATYASRSEGPQKTGTPMSERSYWANFFKDFLPVIILAVWAFSALYLLFYQWPTSRRPNLGEVLSILFLSAIGGVFMLIFIGSAVFTLSFFLMGISQIFAESFTKAQATLNSPSSSRLWRDLGLWVSMLVIGLMIVLPAFLGWPMPWLQTRSGFYAFLAFVHVILHILSLLLIPFVTLELIAILVCLSWSRPVSRRTEALLEISGAD